MSLTPLNDRVLVKRNAVSIQSQGGILLLDIGAEKPDQGEVIAVGPGLLSENGTRLELTVKVGDQVLFGKTSGSPVKSTAGDLVALREDELFAIIDKE